jgi:gliding motility-associated-like protein
MVKKILLAFLLFKISALHLCAQPSFTWAKQLAGTDSEQGTAVALDDSGNVYSCGIFKNTVDFDPGAAVFNLTAGNSFDIYLSKLSPSGNFVWAKQMKGAGLADKISSGIAVDKMKNIYLVGNFFEVTDFDPGQGVQLLDPSNGNLFVCKLNSLGSLIWAAQLGDSNTVVNSLALDDSSNIILTGIFSDTIDFDPGSGLSELISSGLSDVFVTKLDPSGIFKWAAHMGGEKNEMSNDVAIDKSGNVIICGDFSDTADFDPGSGLANLYGLSETKKDIFVCKLTGDGSFLWARILRGAQDESAISVDVDACDNVYTTGYFQDTVDFNPGNTNFDIISVSGNDAFVSKLGPAGNFIWARSFSGLNAQSGKVIQIDLYGDVYIGGTFNDTTDFNPGNGTLQFFSSGQEDIFIAKLDALGNFLCAGQMGGAGNDGISGLAINGADNVYSTGFFSQVSDFDPTASAFALAAAGNEDAFVTKLGPGTCCPVLPPPASASGSPNPICKGDASSLSVVPSVPGTCPNWRWYKSSCGQQPVASGDTIGVAPPVTTTYYVRSEGACDTTVCASVTITVKGKPVAAFTSEFEVSCEGINGEFINESINAHSYEWDFGDNGTSTAANPSHQFGFNSYYLVTLIASNNNGCKDTVSQPKIFSAFTDFLNVHVPNIFTPNNDGINDEFYLDTDQDFLDCFDFAIFDRWGIQVFSADNSAFRWNGKRPGGTKVQPGTYFYVLEVYGTKMRGAITVID